MKMVVHVDLVFLKSPWLEIIGRVGMADVKTCAAGAAELLKGEGAT